MTSRVAAGSLLAVALLLSSAGCSRDADPSPTGSVAASTTGSGTGPVQDGSSASGTGADGGGPVPLDQLASSPDVVQLVPQVVTTAAHDPAAFTQGLEEHDGRLLESTGRYGESDRRWVDPSTGTVLASVTLPAEHFGEGVTIVDDRIIQLTWQEGVAHIADLETLESEGSVSYAGEGWGLCHDGHRLVMSDGSATLRFRDPVSFEEVGRVEVALDGRPVEALNELECADGLVWANVWTTNTIVAVEPATGRVVAVVDATSLVPDGLDPAAVLNGIARRDGTDTFWLTGKLWPVLHEVHLVRAP